MSSEVNISVKPFACTNEGCDMSFTNEDHLMVHKKKHDMNLNLGLGIKSNVFNDQTPTPTRFLRNCEEVGLFQDLQNVNPFEETFRRATEQVKSGNIPIPDIQMNADDTLHTPHVFPTIVSENFILKNDSVVTKLTEVEYEIKTPLILKSEQKKELSDESSVDKNNKVMNCVSDQENKKLEQSLLQEDNSSMLNNLLNSTKHLTSDHNYNMVEKQSEEPQKITFNEDSNGEKDDCHDKQNLNLTSQSNNQQKIIFNSNNTLLKSTCITKVSEKELILSNNEMIKINNVKSYTQSNTKEKIKAVLLKNKVKSSNKQTVTITPNASVVRNIAPQPLALTSIIPNSLILSGNCIGTPFINSGQLQTISIVPTLKIPIEEKSTSKLVLPKNFQSLQDENKTIKNNYSGRKKLIKRNNLKMPSQTSEDADIRKNDDLESSEDKLKKEMSLERNRAAAHRARTKRKLWIDTLVKNNVLLTKANKELITEVQKLRSEVAQLKSLLLTHKSCEITRALNSSNADDIHMSGNSQIIQQINVATMKSDVTAIEKTSLQNAKQFAIKRQFENEEVNITKCNPKTNIIHPKKIKPNIQPLCIPLITVTNFSNEVK